MPQNTAFPSGEFNAAIAVKDLSAQGAWSIARDASAEEQSATARRIGAMQVEQMRVEAEIAPWRGAGWRANGIVRAEVTQACVITLEPIRARIEEAFSQTYLPAKLLGDAGEVVIDAGAEDPPEALGEQIDIGGLAVETLAVSLDPYPRAPGAELPTVTIGPPGTAPMTDEDARPFAKLAALRRSQGQT